MLDFGGNVLRHGPVDQVRVTEPQGDGTGEAPACPVFIDGQKFTTLKGTYDELAAEFRSLVDSYVATKFPRIGDRGQEPQIG